MYLLKQCDGETADPKRMSFQLRLNIQQQICDPGSKLQCTMHLLVHLRQLARGRRLLMLRDLGVRQISSLHKEHC